MINRRPFQIDNHNRVLGPTENREYRPCLNLLSQPLKAGEFVREISAESASLPRQYRRARSRLRTVNATWAQPKK